MAIQARQSCDGSQIAITVTGHFGFDDHRAFQRAITASCAVKVVEIDLAACTKLDSAAIGMLGNLEDFAREQGFDVRVVGCTGTPREIMELVRLDHLLA